MELDGINYSNDMRHLQSKCQKYLYFNVTLIVSDGRIFDGMIENVDQDRMTMLVGEDVMDLDDDDDDDDYDGTRQHGHVGFHRRPRRRFRRFRRVFFPFSNIAGLELLPFMPSHPHHFF